MKSLIIGASRGIGLELAKQLDLAGCQVLATARDASGLKTLEQYGVTPIALDVSQTLSMDKFKDNLQGQIFDLIVYVAGVFGPKTDAKEGVEIEDFDAVMHTNVLGAMQIISTLAPQVTPQTGKMVFMSSLMASIELTNSSSAWVYKASKAALNMCVKSASSSYPNICMLSMSPGWVKTDMGGEFAPLTPSESVKGILQTIAQTSLVDTGRFLNYLNTKLPY